MTRQGEANRAENGHNGRDDNGWFAAGNASGPGNPYARQVAELRFYFMQGVTPEVMQQFAAKLIQMGLNGHLGAMKLVLSYVLGKPGAAVDPDLLDQHEWQIHRQSTIKPSEVAEVFQRGLPVEVANVMVGAALPGLGQQAADEYCRKNAEVERKQAAEAARVEKARARREAKKARQAAPDCRLQNADCRLPNDEAQVGRAASTPRQTDQTANADCRLQNADCRLSIEDAQVGRAASTPRQTDQTANADCRLPIEEAHSAAEVRVPVARVPVSHIGPRGEVAQGVPSQAKTRTP